MAKGINVYDDNIIIDDAAKLDESSLFHPNKFMTYFVNKLASNSNTISVSSKLLCIAFFSKIMKL
jgi:hypothetical protein